MKKKIKILYFIDYLYGFSGGGTEIHLSYLTRLLDRNKFECLIVAFDTDDTPITRRIKSHGTGIVHVPVEKIYTVNALRQAIVLARLIKNYQPDIVQTFHFKSDTYGVMIARLLGCHAILSSKRDLGLNKRKYHMITNRIINKLLEKYERNIPDAPIGKSFQELYEVRKAKPTKEAMAQYRRIVKDLKNIGFVFAN